MTETIMPPEMLASLSPEFIVPLVAALSHPDGPDASGKVFELGAGFVAEIRWERTKGAHFKTDATFTPSAIKQRWNEITDFTNPDHPKSLMDNDVQVSLAPDFYCEVELLKFDRARHTSLPHGQLNQLSPTLKSGLTARP